MLFESRKIRLTIVDENVHGREFLLNRLSECSNGFHLASIAFGVEDFSLKKRTIDGRLDCFLRSFRVSDTSKFKTKEKKII
jgi:hypothetical protein